jgi:TatD DNase family protein
MFRKDINNWMQSHQKGLIETIKKTQFYGMVTPIRLIDTHCHLYDEGFQFNMNDVLSRSRTAGVRKILLPNIDRHSIDAMLELEKDHPGYCMPMMGIHPCYVKDDWQEQVEIVRDWLAVRRFTGIGEIGLDFHWDLTFKEQQIKVFAMQLEWALRYDLPVSIHSRKATRACIDWIRAIGKGRIRGVFHCFSGSVQEAEEIMDLGMFLGIGGVVTYKNAGLVDVLRAIGLSRIVLETDAPYLAPVPFRGKQNEPAHLTHIAQKIAEILEISVEEVGRITTGNAEDLFG